MNKKFLFLIFFIFNCIASRMATAECAKGERRCGVDGYIERCSRLYADSDYEWQSTSVKCQSTIEHEKICEPGLERCGPDGQVQRCEYEGKRWVNQIYRKCKPGDQSTIEQEQRD